MTDATSPQGAVVSYTVRATDPDNAPSQLTITCAPASGSTFAIGTTTVNCTASDLTSFINHVNCQQPSGQRDVVKERISCVADVVVVVAR